MIFLRIKKSSRS